MLRCHERRGQCSPRISGGSPLRDCRADQNCRRLWRRVLATGQLCPYLTRFRHGLLYSRFDLAGCYHRVRRHCPLSGTGGPRLSFRGLGPLRGHPRARERPHVSFRGLGPLRGHLRVCERLREWLCVHEAWFRLPQRDGRYALAYPHQRGIVALLARIPNCASRRRRPNRHLTSGRSRNDTSRHRANHRSRSNRADHRRYAPFAEQRRTGRRRGQKSGP